MHPGKDSLERTKSFYFSNDVEVFHIRCYEATRYLTKMCLDSYRFSVVLSRQGIHVLAAASFRNSVILLDEKNAFIWKQAQHASSLSAQKLFCGRSHTIIHEGKYDGG